MPPRPTWKGHISFGLVSIPVSLFPAEKRSEEVTFDLLDKRNMARVRYRRVNEVTGREVPWEEIVKGYEIADGEYVILTDEDFKNAAVEATQSVDIEAFVDRDAIDHVYFDKPYYLVPTKKGVKGYALLREALRSADKVGIAKVVIRSRQHLAAVIPKEGALVLDLLRFHHELRDTQEFELPGENLEKLRVSARETKMAEQLVGSMADDWKPEEYEDEYRKVLLEYIERKHRAGKTRLPPVKGEEAEEGGEIIDLMDALKKSVERSKKGARAAQRPARKVAAAAATQARQRKKGAERWLRKSEQGDRWNRCLDGA